MPEINIPDKICSHCNGTRWYIRTTKDGVLIQICAIKKNEYNKKWRYKFPEKANAIWKRSKDKVKDTDEYKRKNRERVNKWNKANPEKTKLKIKASMLKHKEKYNKVSREGAKRYRENLSDNYMAALIRGETRGLYLSDMPKDLLDIKRKQILLKRQIA